MEIKNNKFSGTFQDYISMAEVLLGNDNSLLYLEKNKELFNHPNFYKEWCKVYDVESVSKKFTKNTIWATFHPDWNTNFGEIIILKNSKKLYATCDTALALQILNM
jgi:hypothetical protein